MNVPAVAQKTFDELKNNPQYGEIVPLVKAELEKLTDPILRARLIHNLVEEFNREPFSHPLVKQYSPCKAGCTGCCHTQVSITEDEAHLLAAHALEIGIDLDRLELQASAGNSSEKFYDLSFADRKCVFLDEAGNCRIYEDRPAVCRTNTVLGEASQCDTSRGQPRRMVLVKTPDSDMVIYAAFSHAKEAGTLPKLLAQVLSEINSDLSCG